MRRLAVGGMAELYLADQLLLGSIPRRVVVKRILADKLDDDEFMTMFADEARLMARLSHPNVAAVLDAGTIGVEPFMALEYVSGASLGQLMQASAATPLGVLSENEALAMLLQVAEALAYVHEARDERGRPMNIVHRDLTPANVIISFDGAAKLIDFGIAKGENRVYQTTTGVLKGTCGYMAPEQLSEEQQIDFRTDIFAFGVIFYEAVCGRPAFTAKQVVQLYDQVLNARYAPPRSVRPGLAAGLASLIDACLARDPRQRPASMHVVAAALRDELARRTSRPLMSEIGALVRILCPPTDGGGAADIETDPTAEPEGEWVTAIDHER
ncbi:MAG: serine/threonine-protein kinase [Myxococcota bacterium]